MRARGIMPRTWASTASALAPIFARRSASNTMLASGPAMVRVSMMRMSWPGKSARAISADRTVPLTSAEGWMHTTLSPSCVTSVNASMKSPGYGAAVLGSSRPAFSRAMNAA